MRKIPYLAAAVLSAAAPAFAQTGADGVPIIVPSQSSIYNQNSVNLPSPPTVHGQDNVRGASGVSCQSSVAGGGPYLDLGVIGSQDVFNRDTAAVYGRIVVPLGERPKRIDCTRLYELEIARMKMEIDMMRLGMAVKTVAEPSPENASPHRLHGEAVSAQEKAAIPPQTVSVMPVREPAPPLREGDDI